MRERGRERERESEDEQRMEVNEEYKIVFCMYNVLKPDGLCIGVKITYLISRKN